MFNRWPFNRSTDADPEGLDRINRELAALEPARAEGIAWLLDRLNRALWDGDAEAVVRCREELEQFLQAARAMPELPALVQAALTPAAPPGPVEEMPTYCITSATLAQAHAYLTRHLPGSNQEPEWMLAVTGLRRGQVRTLEHLIEVQLASQSPGQASFDMQDFTRIAVSLHEHGQALHAIFHSHRFSGPPSPSGTDDRLQRVLEEGGYPAIQAVFSEDGYVRFFARRREFAVEVYGKGVKKVDRTLYRIVHFSPLPHPTPAAR